MKHVIAVTTLTLGILFTGCGVGYLEGDDTGTGAQSEALRKGGDGGVTIIPQKFCDLYTDKVSCFADSRCTWFHNTQPVFNGKGSSSTGTCADKSTAGGGGVTSGGSAGVNP